MPVPNRPRRFLAKEILSDLKPLEGVHKWAPPQAFSEITLVLPLYRQQTNDLCMGQHRIGVALQRCIILNGKVIV